jgi:predicted RNase H-like HicB family nuclease
MEERNDHKHGRVGPISIFREGDVRIVFRRSRMREMARQFDVVIERDEEGMYVASVPQLPGCHTDAASLDELMAEIREAIELCLEVQGEGHVPLEFIGIQRVTIAA